MGVAWHRFLAFFNIWFKRESSGRTALGAVKPLTSAGKAITLDDIDDLDEDSVLGVGSIEDFSWKGILDFTTCTECGRCQSQCPAWNTEKPLSPKLLITALRDHAYAKAPYLQAARGGARGAPRGQRHPDQGGRAPAGRRDRRRLVLHARERRRGHRPRRAVVLHLLRRLRPAVPGRHRARRPHHRHAPLRGPGRVELPGRAQRALQGPGEQGQPVEHVAERAHGLGQGPRLRGQGRRRDDRVARRGRLAVLGRLRRRLRGPRQEDHPRRRRAARHGRRQLRRARQRRDLHRRPGPPRRQRVRLPGPGPAERRDVQGVQGQEGRLDLRPLLQHAQERVQGVRRRARGRPPHPAAQPAGARGQADPGRRTAPAPRSARSPTTTPATSAATTASTPRRASCSRSCPAPSSSRWSATPSGPSAAAPVAPACGWRRTSASGSTSTAPRRPSAPAPTRSRSAARSAG